MHKIDHIGIAVADLESAITFYKTSFGFEVHEREVIESQQVSLAFMGKTGETQIELLAPLKSSSQEQTALRKFLDEKGPGLHHICYEVGDIVQELKRLKSQGFRLIDETPRPGARGSKIAFIHPKSCLGVLTELCQYF